MTILPADIKILASQRLADTPDGGGRMTGVVVQDGQDNNIFDDVASFDRVYGNDSLRKVFAAVLTDNTDKYLGVRVIIDAGPSDATVSANIFSTNSSFDVRSDAANRLESYLIGGSRLNGFLFENHVTNQRSIQICQRVGANAPLPGETLYLVYNEGLVSERAQYIRVTRTEVEQRLFTDPTGDFPAQIVSCELSDALRYDFPGTGSNRQLQAASTATALKGTVIADAGTYSGIAPLAASGVIGDTTVQVASIYSQIVPASRTEVSTLDLLPAASSVVTLATAPRLVEVPVASHSYRIKIGQTNRGYNYVYLMTPRPAAGTVTVSYRALGRWYTLTDNGDGTLGGTGSGTINYSSGSISVTLQAFPDAGSGVIFAWAEVANYTSRSHSVGFRAPEFAFNIGRTHLLPGQIAVTYTSGGQVITATDNGAGKFTGPDLFGDVDYASGDLSLRPRAIIDAGGQFQINYKGAAETVFERPVATVDPAGYLQFSLAQTPLAGSVNIAWESAFTLSDTGGGSFAGGRFLLTQDGLQKFISKPAVGIGSGSYQYVVTTRDPASTSVLRQGIVNNVNNDARYALIANAITDSSAGVFVGGAGSVNAGARTVSLKAVIGPSAVSGYENDAEKASTFSAVNGLTNGAVTGQTAAGGSTADTLGGGPTSVAVLGEYVGNLTASYITDAAAGPLLSYTFTPPAVVIDLAPNTADSIVQNSVQFTWMGAVYQDAEGTLYRGRTDTAPGIAVGSLDYSSGLATVTDYTASGPATAFTLDSLFTRSAIYRASRVFFHTLAAPVKPSGFILSVTDVTGALLVASAGLDGQVRGDHIIGRIDYESGVVDIIFGDYLAAAPLSSIAKAEWWYSADQIDLSGNIFRPWPVLPETLRYNVVSYFYLPLDAAILGLDPVRLPQDGRVPIFRPGRVVVIHNTQRLAAVNVSNGQTISAGRTRLSRLRVIGADGFEIFNGFTTDLDAGTVNFGNTSGYSQPVTIEHRIEDESVCTEAQITGELKLLRQLSHAFPAGSTYVSSALLAGTLQAAAGESFSQQTWTNVWSDDRIGSSITAQYNQALFPIEVSNKGAITERWAIIFINNTNFRVIGEESGEIMTGSINTTTAPVNPATGVPYWAIESTGWGAGWVAGNTLRFNTTGANFPIWVVRTVLQSPAGQPGSDQLTLSVRGDINV